ncbi:MAG: DNA polymerase subunit beta [Leptolyngbyaceae cyanobacterium SL_5_9]|nr:DNA polymerase subunit beta [Leptolyngbyaceae cyanobacterium SL_5_9]NJO75342.1 DNA polymerase subunit beta [Leptolyngbyaceae cyanobacterium RM1_406_9]
MQEIYQRLNTTPQELAAFCEKWQIVELALFGSILRDDFRYDGDDPSDIDLLYVSSPQARYGFTFLNMKEELEELLGRKVDLISEVGIQSSRNWLRRKIILESKQVIYAKRSAVNH